MDVFKNSADVQEGVCGAFCYAFAFNVATKGSFSVAIDSATDSGSIVKALGSLAGADRVDFSKVHVFFTNDKVTRSRCS